MRQLTPMSMKFSVDIGAIDSSVQRSLAGMMHTSRLGAMGFFRRKWGPWQG